MNIDQPIDIWFDGYHITSDKTLLHIDQVHQWLSTYSYWAKDIPCSIVETSFYNSFTIGILKGDEQVGYARVITDYAVFGYLADVFVKEEHRGRGLSKQMLQAILGQSWVQQCRKLMLATKDAHGLYRQYGFTDLETPGRIMELAHQQDYNTTV